MKFLTYVSSKNREGKSNIVFEFHRNFYSIFSEWTDYTDYWFAANLCCTKLVAKSACSRILLSRICSRMGFGSACFEHQELVRDQYKILSK